MASGAYSVGAFELNEGDILHILVGGVGNASNGSGNWGGGSGGGGTFVGCGNQLNNATPLIVAGGGGGAGGGSTESGEPGGAGGTTLITNPEDEVQTTSQTYGSGAAGFSFDGWGTLVHPGSEVTKALAFIHGGIGGEDTLFGAKGGFGGGGTASSAYGGGGGGFIGGDTDWKSSNRYGRGLGGASFNVGLEQQNFSGVQTFNNPNGTSETGHSGNGYARITLVE